MDLSELVTSVVYLILALASLAYFATASIMYLKYTELLDVIRRYWELLLGYAEKGTFISVTPPVPSPPTIAPSLPSIPINVTST